MASGSQKKSGAGNVILVHGALADGSGWRGVYDRLKEKGFKVSIVQQPMTTAEADVQAVKRAIDLVDGTVVLVAHSYGGLLISEAGGDPKVTSLVYVAAAVPDVGESVAGLASANPGAGADAVKLTADGFVILDTERFQDTFAANLPKADTDFMAVSQVLISTTAFGAEAKVAAWKTKPCYGIVPEFDRALNPEVERSMYRRANAKITEIAGASHAVYISHPAEVAAVIEEAASN